MATVGVKGLTKETFHTNNHMFYSKHADRWHQRTWWVWRLRQRDVHWTGKSQRFSTQQHNMQRIKRSQSVLCHSRQPRPRLTVQMMKIISDRTMFGEST